MLTMTTTALKKHQAGSLINLKYQLSYKFSELKIFTYARNRIGFQYWIESIVSIMRGTNATVTDQILSVLSQKLEETQTL